jgi:hypothetical protein
MLGAEQKGDSLLVLIKTDQPWEGKLFFDKKRFKENMKLPIDWPRINQFPEWFTVERDRKYVMIDVDQTKRSNPGGSDLINGIDIKIEGEQRFIVY